MEKPLISYVVTAYNIERFVREAVECAFAQTYSPLEIVLSDDCSSDRTFEIMEKMVAEYRGPHKIKLNRNESNLGITRHMNKAYLELAEGEIIVSAHADDVSAPERTCVMTDFMLANPNVTQVACSATVVDENGNPYDDYVQKGVQVREVHRYEFGSGAHVAVGFSAFRRRVMDYFGPLGERCPTEDDPIGFRAILLGDIAYIPDLLIEYRKHSGSNSRPELFDKFPVDEIFNQNIADMDIALKNGLITAEQYGKEKIRLFEMKEIRKKYRVYFSRRTLRSLYKLLCCKYLNNRRRLSYLREHLEYLAGHHE